VVVTRDEAGIRRLVGARRAVVATLFALAVATTLSGGAAGALLAPGTGSTGSTGGSTGPPTTTTTAVPTTVTTAPATTTTTRPPRTTTTSTTTTAPTTTTSVPTTTTSSTSPWWWVLLAVLLALAVLLVVLLARRRSSSRAMGGWRREVAPAVEQARLARSMLQAGTVDVHSEQWQSVRNRTEDAARSLERAAAHAPSDDGRLRSRRTAEALRGLAFAVEANALVRNERPPPTGEQLLEADAAIRSRAADLDASLRNLDALVEPEGAADAAQA
jgi:hypothetical protein